MIDAGHVQSRRHCDGPAPFGKGEHADLRFGNACQIRIDRPSGEPVCIVLHGELDITSMQYFERVLAEVMSSDPSGLIFDVSGAEFIAGQAYEAMARCSRTTRVEVRGVGAVASRILAAYGYHHSVV